MYLNQFTNTKNSVQALSLHHDKRLQWIHVRVKPKIPSNSFSSTKMTWDILFHTLSASKMSSTRCIIQKEKKKSQFHKTVLTLQHRYLCRIIYTNLKNIHPLRRIYHKYLQLTGKSRKLQNLPIMLLGHHRMFFPVAAVAWKVFYSQVFTRSIQTGKFLW